MATFLVQYFMEEETHNHVPKEKSLVEDYGQTWLEQMVIFFSMKLPKDTFFLRGRRVEWRILVWKDLLVQYLFRFGLKWPMYKWSHIGIFQIRVALEILLPCIQRLLLSQRVWKEDSAEKEHTDRDHRRTVPPRRGLPVEESPSGGCSWIGETKITRKFPAVAAWQHCRVRVYNEFWNYSDGRVPELRFVATVTTKSRVKCVPTV